MAKSVVSGFQWKVMNVLFINNLESDEFVLYESRWRLRLSARNSFISIYLNKQNAERLNWTSKIRAFIENRNDEIENTRYNVLDDPNFTTKMIWWIHRDVLRERRDKYLTDGTLTLVVVFTPRDILEKDAMSVKVPDKSIPASVNGDMLADLENLSLDLRHLLDGRDQSDVTLRCGESSFPAHKNILSARSEVFSAMFRSDMAESRTGLIQISDMDAYVLDQFLHYVYTGKLPDLSVDTARKLYEAADKYSVESLKKLCAKFMEGNLTRGNACRILVLADAHGDKRLKDSVLCFITNVELLRDKDVWSEFHNEHPKLAGEVAYHAYEAKCLSTVN